MEDYTEGEGNWLLQGYGGAFPKSFHKYSNSKPVGNKGIKLLFHI